MEKLADEKSRYTTALKFNLGRRAGIAAGARTTIKLRHRQWTAAQTYAEKKAVLKKLETDLKYGWLHKYDNHEHCDADWCRIAAHVKQKSTEEPCQIEEDLDGQWDIAGKADDDIFGQPKGSRVKPPTEEEKN